LPPNCAGIPGGRSVLGRIGWNGGRSWQSAVGGSANVGPWAQLTGWSDRAGAASRLRAPPFQDFNVSCLASCPAWPLVAKERSPPGMAQCLQTVEVFWPPMTPSASPPSRRALPSDERNLPGQLWRSLLTVSSSTCTGACHGVPNLQWVRPLAICARLSGPERGIRTYRRRFEARADSSRQTAKAWQRFFF